MASGYPQPTAPYSMNQNASPYPMGQQGAPYPMGQGQQGVPYPMGQQGAPYPSPNAYGSPAPYPQPVQYAPPVQSQPVAQFSPPNQTQNVVWMTPPQASNCPRGLEYLSQIDHLFIKQKVELLEAITSFETKNKYKIKNSQGQQVYYAKEDTDCLTRMCCGPNRPFEMQILDNTDYEVIHLSRPLACDTCFFPCCLMNIDVSSPPGTIIGSVQQDWSILSPEYSVKDANGNTVLKIEGPLCTYSFCGAVEFKVMSADGSVQVGKISKEWGGMLREMFTDADCFGVSFPMDLDVRMKATLMGAAFLIDFMFFERKGQERNDGFGMLG